MLNHKSFGEGPALVVLHGLFGMLDNWQTLARRWAGTRRVVLVDLRNHGRSPHRPDMNYDLMARDVAELLEALHIDHCYLLGHSMGGKVAMQTALTYPDLVDRLLIVDIAPRRYRPGHDTIFAALEALDPAAVGSRKAAAAALGAYVADPGVQLFLLKNLARDPAGGYRWRMNLPVIKENYPRLIGPVGKAGENFGGPALFVRGGNSRYVREEDVEGIELFFPAAKLVTVEGAGHWVHAEAPEAMSELVDEFLTE